MKLKQAQVAQVRTALLKKQGHACPLCGGSLRTGASKKPALDHDHTTGAIRDVLCVNCNGIEGKVFNLARRAKAGNTVAGWLENLVAYLERHSTPQHGLIHPTHKTPEDKRLARNKRAVALRKKRLEKK